MTIRTRTFRFDPETEEAVVETDAPARTIRGRVETAVLGVATVIGIVAFPAVLGVHMALSRVEGGI